MGVVVFGSERDHAQAHLINALYRRTLQHLS
jgi:hypothetical protein